jgi:hypothetical protein
VWQQVGVDICTEPAQVTAWLAGPGSGRPDRTGTADDAEPATPYRSAVVVDDLHLWEGRWSEPEVRTALQELARLAEAVQTGARPGIALLAATGADQLRECSVNPSLTAALRRARRAVLLAPTDSDAMFLSAELPPFTVEPTAGVARGLLTDGGRSRVVQLIGV